MLVLQQLFEFSDKEIESQVNVRRSFEEFVGLGVMNDMQDADVTPFAAPALIGAGAAKGVTSTR